MTSRRRILENLSYATALAAAGPLVPALAASSLIRFVYFDKFEPLSFRAANGSMNGLLIDVVALVCGEAGLSPRHDGLPWARAQKELQAGKFDAFCTNPTESRRKFAKFCAQPLVVNRNGALHRKGDRRFQGFQEKSDMKGINLADYLGNKWIEAELGDVVSFNWVSSQYQVFELVARGRSDAVIVSEIEGNHLLRTRGLGREMAFTHLPFMPSDTYTVGVRRSLDDVDDVVSRLNDATNRVQQDGRLKAIMSRYV